MRKNTKSDKTSDLKLSNGLIVGIGSVLVVVTLTLCILGTSTALSSMNRKMETALAEARQAASDVKVVRELTEDVQQAPVVNDDDEQWTSDQIEWMRENHIRFDGEHFVDANGNIVDDPTQKSNKDESDDKPEKAQNWWDGNEFVQVDESGEPYYEVQKGDTLNKIGKMTGFSADELSKHNNIKSPYILYRGNIIKFPARDGETEIDRSKGLG